MPFLNTVKTVRILARDNSMLNAIWFE